MRGVLVCTSILPCFAFATDVSGDQSGTWTAASNPYRLVGDVRVPAGETLVVQPGVQVIAQGYFKVVVEGKLLAVGTAAQPVLWTSAQPTTGWRGVRLIAASDQSLVDNCVFEYARGTGEWPEVQGGALIVRNCSPTIRNSIFRFNSSRNANFNGVGAGVLLETSSSLVENNQFLNNQCDSGAGVCAMEYGFPIIKGNLFDSNSSTYAGGGIYLGARNSGTVIGNRFFRNTSGGYGGGAINSWTSYIFYATFPVIQNNLIARNSAGAGAGIYCRYDRAIITNNTIVDNNGHGIYALNYPEQAPIVSGCILWGNSGGALRLEQSTGSAITVTYSCVQGGYVGAGNVSANPLFVNAAADNYQLGFGSPCVDAGDNNWLGGVNEDILGNPRRVDDPKRPDTGIGPSDADRVVAGRWPKMSWTEAQLYDDDEQYDQYLQLVYSTIFRSVYSRRMLYERMVEFWTDHFNIHADKVGAALMTTYIQKNIRRHAMGKFSDLLRSTAHSAAMLSYLDNDDNSANAPNINYSRELHELHTVGVDGGYTGKDLRQAALVLSGWTWSWRHDSANRGRFRFDIDDHAGGSKVVMGRTYVEDGQAEGERLLNYLSTHPNTARFITKKLIKWFLGEGVPAQVWTDAQAVFKSTGGDIRAVLRVILTQPNLMASNAKYKRPSHLLYSAFRGCKSRIYQYGSILYGPLNAAGHIPFDWSPPDGYPDRFEYWAPSQLPRINMAFRIARNGIHEVTTDIVREFGNDRTAVGCFNTISKKLFGSEMADADKTALIAFLQKETITDERLVEAVALAIACPSFQWY